MQYVSQSIILRPFFQDNPGEPVLSQRDLLEQPLDFMSWLSLLLAL